MKTKRVEVGPHRSSFTSDLLLSLKYGVDWPLLEAGALPPPPPPAGRPTGVDPGTEP